MIKEAFWMDGRMGWDWMFIIGHGFSHSTFGSNKMKVLGESTTEYSEPSPTVSHFGEIGSL